MPNERSVSMTFKSDNTMPWSSTLEEECRKLASDQEAEDDEILVAMVRVSRICLQATELFRLFNDNPENSGHTALHIGLLKKSLDECRALISDRQKQHCEFDRLNVRWWRGVLSNGVPYPARLALIQRSPR
jgi:hypothetical protein